MPCRSSSGKIVWYQRADPALPTNGRGLPGTIGQVSTTGPAIQVVDPHSSSGSLAVPGRSGSPHPSIVELSGLNRAFDPTRAKAFSQASIWPFFDSDGSSLESQVL